MLSLIGIYSFSDSHEESPPKAKSKQGQQSLPPLLGGYYCLTLQIGIHSKWAVSVHMLYSPMGFIKIRWRKGRKKSSCPLNSFLSVPRKTKSWSGRRSWSGLQADATLWVGWFICTSRFVSKVWRDVHQPWASWLWKRLHRAGWRSCPAARGKSCGCLCPGAKWILPFNLPHKHMSLFFIPSKENPLKSQNLSAQPLREVEALAEG